MTKPPPMLERPIQRGEQQTNPRSYVHEQLSSNPINHLRNPLTSKVSAAHITSRAAIAHQRINRKHPAKRTDLTPPSRPQTVQTC